LFFSFIKPTQKEEKKKRIVVYRRFCT